MLIPSKVSSFSMYTVILLLLIILQAPPDSDFGIPNSSVKNLFPHHHILSSLGSRKKIAGARSGKKESCLTVFSYKLG
jgi:hypothetical protein